MAGYFQGNVYKIPQCEYCSLSVLFFQVKEEASLMAQQVKNHLQCRRHRRWGFDPWVWKIPWRRKWQSTPVFLPGKSRGQRSLVGYSPRGRKGADTTEHTNTWEKSCLIHNSDSCKVLWLEIVIMLWCVAAVYFPHRVFQKHTLKDPDVVIFTISSRAFWSRTGGLFVIFLFMVMKNIMTTNLVRCHGLYWCWYIKFHRHCSCTIGANVNIV